MISSQVPVGFCARLEKEFPEHSFIIQPENIRRATADIDFVWQERMVVGRRSLDHDLLIRKVLSCFAATILWMSPESAEMTKHALNGWLALGIAYANEIADLCEAVGADKDDVYKGWTSDARVGRQPLRYGPPFTGGTLGRDVRVMEEIEDSEYNAPIVNTIRFSNKTKDRR
jgi:UDPglucose 6-dehydrogenase